MRGALTKKDTEACFDPAFLEDLRFWVEIERKLALRLLDLVGAVLRDPFAGIGKPEPLKHLAMGTWSRRLTQKDRLWCDARLSHAVRRGF